MSETSNSSTSNLTRGLISWGIKGLLYKGYVALVLMLSAGDWTWRAGWNYVIIFLAFDVATALVVIPRNPDLLIERSRSNPDAKTWDKLIMPLAAGILPLIGWILAGLTYRFNWAPDVSPAWQFTGLVLTIIGYGIIVWAMGANAFFSPMVRIQKERDHQVAKGGPYQYLRHPGYLGAIVFSLGIPIMLNSWWAFIPGLGSVILYLIRTELEDQTLQEELPGYQEYTQEVYYRLIPGIW
jgi:protein-S-isoprenylcysteine O-methyltransferase Ste14